MRPFIGIAMAIVLLAGCTSASDHAPVLGPSMPGGGDALMPDAPPPAVPGVDRLTLHSAIVGRDFVVAVTAPSAEIYGMKQQQPAGHKFPAIYALDGGYDIAGPVAKMMGGQGIMTPAYVVAISYLEGEGRFRDTDFLHRMSPEPGGDIGGGGAKFQQFLTTELKPWLEALYPLDPAQAVFFGHSFGGLFGLNVLASDPGAFASYIIASPSTLRDSELMLDLPRAAARAKDRRVYVAVGGAEIAQMVAGAERAAAMLKSAGVAVEYRAFPGEGHLSYYPQLVPLAFAWALPPGKIAAPSGVVLTQAQLGRLTGDYHFEDGRIATFTTRDGKLVARITNMPGEAVLETVSPNRFTIPAFGVVMTFEGAAGAPPTGVTVTISGADSHAVRR